MSSPEQTLSLFINLVENQYLKADRSDAWLPAWLHQQSDSFTGTIMPSGRQNGTANAFEILAGTELFAVTKQDCVLVASECF